MPKLVIQQELTYKEGLLERLLQENLETYGMALDDPNNIEYPPEYSGLLSFTGLSKLSIPLDRYLDISQYKNIHYKREIFINPFVPFPENDSPFQIYIPKPKIDHEPLKYVDPVKLWRYLNWHTFNDKEEVILSRNQENIWFSLEHHLQTTDNQEIKLWGCEGMIEQYFLGFLEINEFIKRKVISQDSSYIEIIDLDYIAERINSRKNKDNLPESNEDIISIILECLIDQHISDCL